VPQQVAKTEQAPTVIAGKQFAMLVDVRDVIQFHAQTPVFARLDVAGRFLQQTKLAAECDLLLIFQVLIMEYQHAKTVHALVNCGKLFICEGTGQINA
jgi:hypothetical protein